MNSNSYKVIYKNEENYPIMLLKIKNSPEQIFYKGIFNPKMFNKCLAIVGTREESEFGKACVEKIVSCLDKNITIVSGLMTGTDFYAHENAIKYKLSTVGVAYSGIDSNILSNKLCTKVIESGNLIISKFEKIKFPKKYMFVKRDKLIAGVSHAVLVIQAKINSGSLLTVNFAHSLGRKIFVLKSISNDNGEEVLSEGVKQIADLFATPIENGFEINKFFKDI